MKITTTVGVLALAAAVLATPFEAAAVTTFSDTGANTAAIQDTVDAFRAALGDPNNGGAAGPLLTGRREINWDGGGPPVINGTPAVTPFITFQNPRGATFTTPGTGLTQAAASGGTLSLDTINPTYAGLFAPFSPNRLFAPIGSNITDGVFSIPGTAGATPAGVHGFGAVFSDVDLAGGTTIEYFTTDGRSIGIFDVPATTGNQTFSFFGLRTDGPLIGSIRITTGSGALGPDESASFDAVVMDDFIYGEPLVVAVPQPPVVQLLGLGILALGLLSRAARFRSGR